MNQLILAIFNIAYAADPLNQVKLPADPTGAGANIVPLKEYLEYIFPILIYVIAAIAVVAIAIWGLLYMWSRVPGMKALAKDHLASIFWGLLLALGAWLILTTINPKINAAWDYFTQNITEITKTTK